MDIEKHSQEEIEKALELETKLREEGSNTEIQIQEKVEEVIEPKKEEEEEFDKSIETKKPKPKKARTEKQIAAFEKARKTRAENIAKKKAEKEANKPPRGRPKKQPEPEPESSEEEIEEEIVYKKKPKKKVKAKKKVQKVVYLSDDSEESEGEEFDKTIQTIKKKQPVYKEPEPVYQEPVYRPPTSMTQFYNFV